MLIKNMGDHYEVLINHAINLSIDNTINNFRQYLTDIEKEFSQELTKTLYSMFNSGPK